MRQLNKLVTLLLALLLASPVLAQTEGGTDALELSMGSDEGSEAKEGDIYIDANHGDWEVRCILSPQRSIDPCQLYQLLKDEGGNPVAEINVFPIGREEGPVAGATVITPLETLLTQQLSMSVDGGSAKKYPFSWCSRVGCFSRLGFSAEDITSFKRGANATLTIVPVAAADQKVNLNVSLTGFTAGYDDVLARARAAAEAAAAARAAASE